MLERRINHERASDVSATEFRRVATAAGHLEPWFGDTPLDKIGVGEIAKFRAHLVGLGLSSKRINLISCVLPKPLKYAADCDVITKAAKIGLFKTERPEIVAWAYEEYARLLTAAKAEGDDSNVASGFSESDPCFPQVNRLAERRP